MAQITPQSYAQLAAMIHAPNTPETETFFQDWQRAEGGNASYNPFNTTQPWAGASNYNSVGVRNYSDLASGLAATARTLQNGHYSQLMRDLQSGHASARQLATDVANSPWGTGQGVLRVLGQGPSPSSASTPPLPGASPEPGAPYPTSAPPKVAPGDQGQRNLLQALRINGMDPTVVKMLSQHLTPQASLGGAPGAAPAKVTPSDTQGADMGNALVKTAMTQMGKPYQWGGGTKLGQNTDCSGLIVQVYGAHGVQVPRTTYDQWKVGTPVNPKALQPGDAVYFHPGPQGPEHVGMYIGGGKFIEDPHTGSVVHIENLASYPGFMGARRFK